MCVYYFCITNSSLKNKMKCLFSCVHTIRFFLNIQAKDQSKVDMILNTFKVATRMKEFLWTKIKQKIVQVQDIWVSRTSTIRIRVFDWLKPPRGNFHLRMSQHFKIWFNMLKKNPKGPFTSSQLAQRMHFPKKSKIRVLQYKIHLLSKGKSGICGNNQKILNDMTLFTLRCPNQMRITSQSQDPFENGRFGIVR